MTATLELNCARRKLSSALGEQGTQDYFRYMKSWFRKRISKEDFDAEARKLLSGAGAGAGGADLAHLHNEFLLAILNKCQTLANMSPAVVAPPQPVGAASKLSQPSPPPLVATAPTSVVRLQHPSSAPQQDSSPSPDLGKYELQQQQLLLRQAECAVGGAPAGGIPVHGSERLRKGKVKRKSKSGRPSFDHRFQPTAPDGGPVPPPESSAADPRGEGGEPLDPTDPRFLRAEERSLRFCHREPPLLPDAGLIHGRMLVAAWQEDLEGVSDASVEVVVRAAEAQLRKVVMALVMRRRGFRMREGRFPHAVGAPVPNPWLFNSQKRRRREDVEEAHEVSEALESAAASDASSDPMAPAPRLTSADAEQRALYEQACAVDDSSVRSRLGPISPFDLLAVMQQRRSLIPCHSVYAINIERVIARLSHSGHDD